MKIKTRPCRKRCRECRRKELGRKRARWLMEMVKDVRGVVQFPKVGLPEEFRCRRGTATPLYAASEVVAVFVGELNEWECLRKTDVVGK